MPSQKFFEDHPNMMDSLKLLDVRMVTVPGCAQGLKFPSNGMHAKQNMVFLTNSPIFHRQIDRRCSMAHYHGDGLSPGAPPNRWIWTRR